MRRLKVLFFGLILTSVNIFYSCNKDVSTTSPETLVSNGKIIIDSEPRGAQIFINGFNTGKITPDSIIHLEEGTYITMLRFHPFVDVTDTLSLIGDNRVESYLDFYQDTRNYGKISVRTSPEQAMVFIDDSCTNKTTPVILENLWPGKYNITCTAPQHRSSGSVVNVGGGEFKSLNLDLQDTSMCVDYNVSNSELDAFTTGCNEIDQDNIKWIGLPLRGLVKMEGESFTHFTEFNSQLPNNHINCIAIDDRNRKWIGTQEGLMIIDGEQWTIFTEQNSEIPQDFITCITFDKNGDAWIGATDLSWNRFLLHFDGTTWTSIRVNGYICSIGLDNIDRVWVGFSRGFEIWDGESWYNPVPDTLTQHILRQHPVESIFSDETGRVWVAAGGRSWGGGHYVPGGLYVFEGDQFEKVDLREDLISHIHQADNGNIWISCLGDYYSNWLFGHTVATIKIDPSGSITNYEGISYGWPSICFVWSTTDNYGNLWVCTNNKGIMKIKGIN